MDAIDNLGDAIDATRDFLVEQRPGAWLKLAIVVFFVGGTSGAVSPPAFPMDTTGFEITADEIETEVAIGTFDAELTTGDILTLFVVLAGIGLALWLLFSIVRAIMDFVFLESLRSAEVHVRRYGKANLGRALHLFVFRLVIGLLAFALVAVPVALLYVSVSDIGAVAVTTVVLLGLYGFGMFLVYAVIGQVTTEFVAPVMLLEERGILDAWSRFWPTLTGNWTEYVLYFILVWLVRIAAGIAVGILAAIVTIVLSIPFVIAFILLYTIGGTASLVLGVFLALLAIGLVVLAYATLYVPVLTYIRYYALLLLGDTNENFDLIPEQRAAIRNGTARRPNRSAGGGWNGERDSDGSDEREEWSDWDASNDDTDDEGGW